MTPARFITDLSFINDSNAKLNNLHDSILVQNYGSTFAFQASV